MQVAAAAARVVAACSDWFAAERAAPLEAVMTMLLRSLSVPQVICRFHAQASYSNAVTAEIFLESGMLVFRLNRNK